MTPYPSVVALDLDGTVWNGHLDSRVWGRGFNALWPQENNITSVRNDFIYDQSNGNYQLQIYPDVPGIIADILQHGARLAIVSRNTSKAMTDRALWYFKIWDPRKNQTVSITDVMTYDEVYDSSKVNHFKAIQRYSNIAFRDMILFDDESRNNQVEIEIGVTFKACRYGQGLTWHNYNDGLDRWRRNLTISQASLPIAIAGQFPPRSLFVGYCGTRKTTFQRLEQGLRRIDQTRPARWGYGLYISDNPRVAKYFADSVRAEGHETVVCRIFTRDRYYFQALPKIWVPEQDSLQTNNIGFGHNEQAIGDSQENRDDWVRARGATKPYVLFSKHYKMPDMPLPGNARFNEMAIYPQLQDSLFFAAAMPPGELEIQIAQWDAGIRLMEYHTSVASWGIRVPDETRVDIATHGEYLA